MTRKVRWLSYMSIFFLHAVRALQAQPVDTSAVRRALRDFDSACASPGAHAWSRDICGPIILVDRATRAAFANRADPAGRFVREGQMFSGQASADIPFANTSFAWQGQRWAVVMLPIPDARWNALALLAHEATHRLQDSLGWVRHDANNAHLDTEGGRLWWRLELRALQHALTTVGGAQRAHVQAAMQFRRERQRLFPGSAATEDALEFAEGTAEYLGERVAHGTSNLGPLMTVNYTRSVESSPTLVRSAAYATGPAMGLLLDALAPGWPARLAASHSMSGLLMHAVRVPSAQLSPDSVRQLAEPYGYSRIAREESDRAKRQRETRERLMALLVTGPTLILRQDGASRTFDPNTLVPFDSLGTVYPTGTFAAVWGRLDVNGGGALLSNDGKLIRVTASGPDNAPLVDGATGTIRGAQWVLTLKAGWRLRVGARAGDFEVSNTP